MKPLPIAEVAQRLEGMEIEEDKRCEYLPLGMEEEIVGCPRCDGFGNKYQRINAQGIPEGDLEEFCFWASEGLLSKKVRAYLDTVPEPLWAAAKTADHTKYFLGMIYDVWTQDRGAFLGGKVGSGKTITAIRMGKHLVRRRRLPGVYISARRLSVYIAHIGVMESAREFLIDLMERASRGEVLVLDDLGRERRTDAVTDWIVGLIAEAFDNGSPMVIASNHKREPLDNRYGKDIGSRLFDRGWLQVFEEGAIDDKK